MPAARRKAVAAAAAPEPKVTPPVAEPETEPTGGAMRIGLHNLKPAPGSRRPRKRVGRGEGSGTGKTAGRGQKGYNARSGAKYRAHFEGGQMPIHMRMRKLRGPHMKKSMPFERFRTHTQPVNLRDLEARFEAGEAITPEALASRGLATRKQIPVKILAKGELSKPLTVQAHYFSVKARAAIEAAGGTCQPLPAVIRRPERTATERAAASARSDGSGSTRET
jgi:large subunit ribosomal protein L15